MIQGNADIKNRVTYPRLHSSKGRKSTDDGDIIMSVRAPVVTVAKSNGNYYIGCGVCAIESEWSEYIYQYFLWNENKWQVHSTGSTFDSITSDTIKELKIPLTAPNKMDKYSKLLSSMDELIEFSSTQSKNIEIKKKYYLNMIFNDKIKDHRLTVKLGDISKLKSGGTPKSSIKEYYNGNIKFLSISDLNGKYLLDTQKKVSKEAIKCSSSWVVPAGTLIYTMYASPAIPFIIKDDIAIPQSVIAIELNDEIDKDFIYYQLQYLYETIMNFTMTGTQANLSGEVVKNIKIKIDTFEKQVNYGKLLSSIDELHELYRDYSNEIINAKKHCMNKIF